MVGEMVSVWTGAGAYYLCFKKSPSEYLLFFNGL